MSSVPASFSVTGWLTIDPNDPDGERVLYSCFDRMNRRGVTLHEIAGSGGYSGQGDSVRLSFGIDDATTPSWRDCGRPNPSSRYVSNSLTVYAGHLYAATTDAADPAARAHVYRYVGGGAWEDIGRPDGVTARGIGPMVCHDGALYVGAWTYDWTVVDSLPMEPVHVYRWTERDGWDDAGAPGVSRRIFSLASFKGQLYAAADDDAVHVLRADGSWTVAGTMPTYPHPMHVYDGRLWVGTVDPGRVWSYDGRYWRDEGCPQKDPVDASQLHSFARFDGALHIGTWPRGLVSVRDAAAGGWLNLGGPIDATEINAMTCFNGMLYVGALPYAELSRYDGDLGWTAVRRLHQRRGWRAAPVAGSGWQSREDLAAMRSGDEAAASSGVTPVDGNLDDAMRLWGRVTSVAEHDGMMFVSTGNATSTAHDGIDGTNLGSVYAMSAGTVATTARSLRRGRRHIAAVRDRGELRLYVDGELAAAATGDIDGPLDVPSEAGQDAGLEHHQWHDHVLSQADVAALAFS